MFPERFASFFGRLFPVWRVRADDPDLWLYDVFAPRAPRATRPQVLIAIIAAVLLPATYHVLFPRMRDIEARIAIMAIIAAMPIAYWWLPSKIADPMTTWSSKLPRWINDVYLGGVQCPAAIDLWLAGATPPVVLAATVREIDTRISRIVSALLALVAIAPAAIATLRPGEIVAVALPLLPLLAAAYFNFLEGFKSLIIAEQCFDVAALWKWLARGLSRNAWRVRYWLTGMIVCALFMLVLSGVVGIYASWMAEAIVVSSPDLLARTAVVAVLAWTFARFFFHLARFRYRAALALAAEHFDDAHRRLASMQPAAR